MNASKTSDIKTDDSSVGVLKRGAHLGAEITGVDLALPLSHDDFALIENAFVENQVLVFRDQDISLDQFVAFARRFGEITVHPFRSREAGSNKLADTGRQDYPELIILDNSGEKPPHSTDQWHSDESFRETPPAATMLRSVITPEIGGDTVFASMTAAYDGLPAPLQKLYETLEALNDFKVFRSLYSHNKEGREKLVEMEEIYPNAAHPVVRVHPVSKKKLIYVSPQTTTKIIGVRDFESEKILDMLYRLPEIPEYQFRVKWESNMIVIWDNRAVQHYAPRDYLPAHRRMERLTIRGDKPFGVARTGQG
jgi:taurine dioxygenase